MRILFRDNLLQLSQVGDGDKFSRVVCVDVFIVRKDANVLLSENEKLKMFVGLNIVNVSRLNALN